MNGYRSESGILRNEVVIRLTHPRSGCKEMDERDVAEALAGPGSVFLDDARSEGSSMLFADPVRQIRANSVADVGHALRDADRALEEGFWVAGYLSYEAGEAFVGARSRETEGPLLWFGVFDAPASVRVTAHASESAPHAHLSIEPEFEEYRRMFSRVKHHIKEGDVYQINLTGRVRFQCADAIALYGRLRARQPVPYGAFIHADRKILSFSPERFFRLDRRRILARPMKGTARRGKDASEDAELARLLAADPKNRAENLMIVDLLRNDLSVVCEPGSVTVPSLFDVEAHPTLWQMTSNVEGLLRSDVKLSDVFGALFPCGSITGAPKRRAMEIIQDVEPWPRGVYCGAIGFASPHGEAEFSVAIRTIEIQGENAVMGSGSGVVWDSDPASEFDEMMLKTRFIQSEPSFDLLETMRCEQGSVRRIERHLSRLRASASALGVSYSESAIRNAIDEALPSGETAVLRLTLRPDGSVNVRRRELPDWSGDPVPVALVQMPAATGGKNARHKTTDRLTYDRARQAAEELGAEEAILVNESKMVTEGSITNVFAEIGGKLLTPPARDGLVPGVLRSEMIERGDVREVSITVDMLEQADAIYIGNAVRGLRRATIIGRADLRHG